MNIPSKPTRQIEESIDDSTFFECIRLLVSEEKKVSKKIALEQLLYLRRKNPSYKERIDSLTQGISLEGTTLDFAQLNEINLSNADFGEATLVGTRLIKANLTSARLAYACLIDTKLASADLTNAYLSSSNLTGADLEDANLTDAKLYRTDLEKAKYYNKAIFKGAIYDEDTKFPPDFDPQKAGCINQSGWREKAT